LALNREYEYKQCTDEVNLKKKKKDHRRSNTNQIQKEGERSIKWISSKTIRGKWGKLTFPKRSPFMFAQMVWSIKRGQHSLENTRTIVQTTLVEQATKEKLKNT